MKQMHFKKLKKHKDKYGLFQPRVAPAVFHPYIHNNL